MNKVSLGRRINSVRKEKQITSEALSEKCGVNAVFIRQIESASRSPSIDTFVKICNALQISPNYLLSDSLDINEQGQFDKLLKKLRSLTPKQINMVSAMIDTIVENSEK